MNRWLSRFILFSLVLHSVVFLFFVRGPFWAESRWGGGHAGPEVSPGEMVWVEIQAAPNTLAESGLIQVKQQTPTNNRSNESFAPTSKNASGSTSSPTGGIGNSPTPLNGSGQGLDASALSSDPSVLKKIRQRILMKRRYPIAGRSQKAEGTVHVLFEIDSSGHLLKASVTQSSGFAVLDDAALDTLKRAEPYPLYTGSINLALIFALEQDVW